MRLVADTFSFRSVGVQILFSALALCALVIPAMAQSTAGLNGTVTDRPFSYYDSFPRGILLAQP